MICPYCKKEAKWIPNEQVYGRRFGKSYMCYYCKDCNAYVGCHNNTKQALGTMANPALRKMRQHVHGILDPLWESGKMKRKEVYQKLRQIFGKEIHVGESDIEQCKDIIRALEKLRTTPLSSSESDLEKGLGNKKE